MKKLMLLMCILVFLFFSCSETEPEIDPIDEEGIVKKNFKAQSFKDGSFYSLEAGKLAVGTYCTVWVERGAGIDKVGAKKVADAFDNNIYQKMIDNFVVTNINGFNFTAELADINADQDGKLLILLLDIKDNYGTTASAVGGYFLWSDLFPSEDNSNGLAMIYVDTNPGKPGETESNKTLAHEMQHLINEITSQVLRFSNSQYSAMDLWIDEGLSTAAEYVYSGSHPNDRWGWYHNNGNGTNIKSNIDQGNNFFVWGNRTSNPYAEIDDYATAYLFFQWLRIHSSNGSGIYKEIIGSANADYKAVTSAASSKIAPSYNNDWGGLLRDWLAANYIYDADSRYGYKNDLPIPNNGKLGKHLLTSGTTASLYPGEGVFSNITDAYVTDNPDMPTNDGTNTNIKYSVLTTAPGDDMEKGVLLTYNANSVNVVDGDFPSPENGAVTGVASISVDISVDGRFVSAPFTLSGPYWVSGTDVLRRNGRAGSLSPAGVPRSSIRIVK